MNETKRLGITKSQLTTTTICRMLVFRTVNSISQDGQGGPKWLVSSIGMENLKNSFSLLILRIQD